MNDRFEDIISADLIATLECENIEIAILGKIESRGYLKYLWIIAVRQKQLKQPEKFIILFTNM